MSDNTALVLLCIVAAILVVLLYRTLTQGRAPDAEAEDSPAPPEERKRRKKPSERPLPKVTVEEDEELELTRMRLRPDDEEDDEGQEETKLETVVPIIYDDEAAVDEPTQPSAFILFSAVGQTDKGRRRKRNEDSYLLLEDPPVYMVADGMGGYAGGDVASGLAVDTVEKLFTTNGFDEATFPRGIPRRGAELVQAVQSANRVIWDETQSNRDLRDMGTTVVAARFSPNKQRVYIGHVGDSRCYLFRKGEIHQITTDHTAGELQGISGPLAATLTRALGIGRKVVVDLILGKPRSGDRYLLCSDGLSKMIDDQKIAALLKQHDGAAEAVEALVAAANEHGGKDNVTVIVVDVEATQPGTS